MNYRLATLLERENHSADITKVIDITLADIVSQFQIIYEPYNTVDGEPTAHPAKCITKIELVDGSDVIFSLTGMEAQAADWYHRKQEPANVLMYLTPMYSLQIYNINFGRFLYDPLFAFDPKKFRNPQLKITIDINGGGCTVTSGYLTVLAHIFDEKVITPQGFLMHKEIKDYALASAAHEYTDLPTDYAYRKLFARIQKYETGPDYCFDTIKLSEDNDKRVPFNHTIGQVLSALVGQTRPYREKILMPGNLNAINYHCTPTYWPAVVATYWITPAVAGYISCYGGDGGRFTMDMNTAANNAQVLMEGHCPHGVIEIPFGNQDDPEDWYDVSKIGNLRLDIKSASGMSSSESCQVFMQQLRKYAAA
jgi:hypothetical protein